MCGAGNIARTSPKTLAKPRFACAMASLSRCGPAVGWENTSAYRSFRTL